MLSDARKVSNTTLHGIFARNTNTKQVNLQESSMAYNTKELLQKQIMPMQWEMPFVDNLGLT